VKVACRLPSGLLQDHLDHAFEDELSRFSRQRRELADERLRKPERGVVIVHARHWPSLASTRRGATMSPLDRGPCGLVGA
jgi:hypothetical protein